MQNVLGAGQQAAQSLDQVDVAIIGASPSASGLADALAANGLVPCLIDDPQAESAQPTHSASSLPWRRSGRVWMVDHGFRIALLGVKRQALHARSLVVAMSKCERRLPFPGSDHPRVSGTETIASPGEGIVVAGFGVALEAAARRCKAQGARLIALIDANTQPQVNEVDSSARRRGAVVIGLQEASTTDSALEIEITREGNGTVERLIADRLVIAQGARPRDDILRMLGAARCLDPTIPGFRPCTDAQYRTSVAGLYAFDADCGPSDRDLPRLARLIQRDIDQGREHWQPDFSPLATAQTQAFGPIGLTVCRSPAKTVVCHCEGLTKEQLQQAIAEGARRMNPLKSATRCGMGECGGRQCEEIIWLLLGQAGEALKELDGWTIRAPLTPLAIDALIDDYAYEQIPIPKAAPL